MRSTIGKELTRHTGLVTAEVVASVTGLVAAFGGGAVTVEGAWRADAVVACAKTSPGGVVAIHIGAFAITLKGTIAQPDGAVTTGDNEVGAIAWHYRGISSCASALVAAHALSVLTTDEGESEEKKQGMCPHCAFAST